MCANIFAIKFHRASNAIRRCAMEDEIAPDCKKPRRADSWQPRALATLSVGFHQPIYGDTTSTREMKGANINIPWDIYIYEHQSDMALPEIW